VQDIPCEADEGSLAFVPCRPWRAHNNLNVTAKRAPHAAVLWWRTWHRTPRSGGGGGLETMGERSHHQPIIISRQPGVPPKQKLIWKMAPVAINIDRPPPTVWVAAALFASCCRIHWRQQRRLATIEAAEGSSRDAAAAVHSCDVLLWVAVTSPSFP